MTAGVQATTASEAARDWEAVRAASDIQFAPVKPAPRSETADWLQAFQEWLGKLFEPLGRWLTDLFAPLAKVFGIPWAAFEKILIGLAAIGLLILLWKIAASLLAKLRERQTAAVEPEWKPDRAEALALLEDADRLADEGRFDEATHLLLKRSVGQIAAARPDWLGPASTAREIAGIIGLPAAARIAFAAIAARVERSRYALRSLAAEDWQAARRAYADFALVELRA